MKPNRTLGTYFTNRGGGKPFYNRAVRKVPVLLVFAALPIIYAASAGLFILVLPQPRPPFAYLVAGAFGAALALIAVLALSVKAPIRTVRKNAQSS